MTSEPQDERQGQVREISAVSNPVVKEIRALAMKKYRDQTGRFMAEGLKLVNDALAGGWQVHILVYGKRMATNQAVMAAAARARAKGALVIEATDKVLAAIARRDNPQMVIGIISQKFYAVDRIKPVGSDLWVALDRVRDPGNLGTIIRTADCAGAAGLILIGETTDPFSLEAVRATMGSLFHVPIARMSEQEFLAWRKKWTGMVVGTHLSGAVDYREPDYRGKPALLLMGNEQQGLPDNLADICDRLVLIPMAGQADSLNLAVATGIMLFEMRRHALGIGTGGR
ncbi:MAG: RNA methyltransferase [Rhizobiaceae bacterium]